MRCPNCDYEIELAWKAIRRGRRALGQCATCGQPSVKYRCLACRVKIAASQRRRGHNPVHDTGIDHEKRSA